MQEKILGDNIIDVESIDIEEPTINFERLESGQGNWLLSPSADLVNSDVLSRVIWGAWP